MKNLFEKVKKIQLKQIFQAFFVAVFFIIILLPVFQMMFSIVKIPGIFENRRFAGFPGGNIFKMFVAPGQTYSKQFETFFNDNYGFRSFLIRAINSFEYHVFNYSPNITVGLEKWMEYRNLLEKDEITSERLSEKEFEALENRFLMLNKILKEKGMTLVILPIPNKSSIYPEYFPDKNYSRPKVTALDRLTTFFKEHPEINFIDAKEILLKAKENYVVFPKTDFHWNEVGAFFVTEALVNKIGELSGTGVKMEEPLKVNVVKNRFRGGLDISLGIWDPIFHDYVAVEDLITIEKPWLDPANVALNVNEKKLPLSLFVGNSFYGKMKDIGLDSWFEQLNWLDGTNNFNYLLTLLKDWPQTKFVIVQFIEAGLGYRLGNPDTWPREVVHESNN